MTATNHPPHRNPGLLVAAASAVALLMLAMAGGCRTTVLSITRPDGTKIVAENYALGQKSEIGRLAVPTPSGEASLEGFKTESGLVDAARDIAAAARQVTSPAVRP